MDAREVIVAQAVANAELMADRDKWRNKCAELERQLAESTKDNVPEAPE